MTKPYNDNFNEIMLDPTSSNKKVVNETVTRSRVPNIDIDVNESTSTAKNISNNENVGAKNIDLNTSHVVDKTDIIAKVNL